MWILGLIILVVAGLVVWELGFKAVGVKPVSPWTLARWIREGRDVTLVDVRTAPERDWASLPGSLWAPDLFPPPARPPESIAALPRDQSVILLCASGHRSSVAGRWLRKQGFQDVHSLSGGVLGWMATGHETVRGADKSGQGRTAVPAAGSVGGSKADPTGGAGLFWGWVLVCVALLAGGLWRHGALLMLLAMAGLLAAMLGFPRRLSAQAAQARAAALAWLNEPWDIRKAAELVLGLALGIIFIWAFWNRHLGIGLLALAATAAFKYLAYRRIVSK